VLDRIDMFVRESRGSLQAAREGRLYREFLSGGMTGAFRVSAAEVDGARKTMAGYAEQTAAAGRVRQRLAGDFETTVASVAEQIASSATELSASAAGLAQAASSAVGEADQARETVSTLEDRSKEIAQVVTVISKVAAQTKLLALNANIEAARAGSAGNGFAVVASEVKELAEQTERATSDIIELVRSVQGVAVESSAVMGSIGDTVREMSSLTHGVAIAVDGSHGVQDTSGSYTGLAEMTELLRCESDRFLVAIRDV
jgi:methyl-accepting chemotaxis protein